MYYQSHHTILNQANSQLGEKLNWFVAIIANNTCIYDCRLLLHHFKVKNSSRQRLMKPGVGSLDNILE